MTSIRNGGRGKDGNACASQMIYLSPVPWSSYAQRPHHFVRWYHKRFGGCVYWLEPYGTRLPNFGDLRRNSQMVLESNACPPWLQRIPVSAVPVEPLPGVRAVNRVLWQDILSRLGKISGKTDTLVVIGKPSRLALAVLENLSHCPSLYDAMDDFPQFYAGLSRRVMAYHERQVLSRVHHVWVSSSWLGIRVSGVRTEAELVMNGLDVSTFPSPEARPMITGARVFGYVGAIGKWFDWQWLIELARYRPDDTIRLIGPRHTSVPRKLPDNVELLPPCDHSVAVQRMQEFDVGLIPFRRTELTRSVDPIKYYEYRALGLPVLSTGFGEIPHHALDDPGVVIVDRREQLPLALERICNHQDSASRILRFRRQNDWGSRFDSARFIRCVW